MKHAALGASGSKRWMTCPGSIALSKGMEDRPSSYAIEGSAAHDLAARCLENDIPDADHYVGEFIEVEREVDGETVTFSVEITEEMAAAVQTYIDLCRNIEASLGEGGEVFIEQQFSLDALGPPAPMFGTTDFAAWDEEAKYLDVVDFKYGQGVAVDAVENTQLYYYALGAVLALGKKPETVCVTIVQPRGHHRKGVVRDEELDWAKLVEFKQTLFEAAEATQDPDAPLVPGEHCRFCLAQPVCPALKEQAVALAQDAFAEYVEDEEPQLPDPRQLKDDELREILDKRDLVEQFFKVVESYVYDRLEAGDEFPGYKLIPKRAYRRWKDEDAVVEWARGLNLPEDKIYKRKLRSPNQMEKLLKQTWPDHNERFDLPEDLVSKQSSGYNVVSEDHPTPGVQIAATEVFEALPPDSNPDE